jgi:hypothetical protein
MPRRRKRLLPSSGLIRSAAIRRVPDPDIAA